MQFITSHYKSLQLIAIHYNSFQSITSHCNLLQFIRSHYKSLQFIAGLYKSLQVITCFFRASQRPVPRQASFPMVFPWVSAPLWSAGVWWQLLDLAFPGQRWALAVDLISTAEHHFNLCSNAAASMIS